MKKINFTQLILLLIFSLLSIKPLQAQVSPPPLIHQSILKTYGFNNGIIETFYDIAPTDDEGGIVVGGFSGFAGYGATVIRFNSSGKVLWQKSYNSSMFNRILSLSNDVFLLAGSKFDQPNNEFDLHVLLINKDGVIITEKLFETTNSDLVHDLILTSTGDIVVTGEAAPSSFYHSPSSYILKIDSNLNPIWIKTANGATPSANFRISKTTPTNDGGFAAVAQISGNSGTGTLVLKFDAQGNIQWKKNFNLSLQASGLEQVFPKLVSIIEDNGKLLAFGYFTKHWASSAALPHAAVSLLVVLNENDGSVQIMVPFSNPPGFTANHGSFGQEILKLRDGSGYLLTLDCHPQFNYPCFATINNNFNVVEAKTINLTAGNHYTSNPYDTYGSPVKRRVTKFTPNGNIVSVGGYSDVTSTVIPNHNAYYTKIIFDNNEFSTDTCSFLSPVDLPAGLAQIPPFDQFPTIDLTITPASITSVPIQTQSSEYVCGVSTDTCKQVSSR